VNSEAFVPSQCLQSFFAKPSCLFVCICVTHNSSNCRAVVLKVENGSLSDKEQGDLRTNELTPFNMALHPSSQTVVVGVGSAGLQVIDVMQQPGSAPTLTLAPGISHLP